MTWLYQKVSTQKCSTSNYVLKNNWFNKYIQDLYLNVCFINSKNDVHVYWVLLNLDIDKLDWYSQSALEFTAVSNPFEAVNSFIVSGLNFMCSPISSFEKFYDKIYYENVLESYRISIKDKFSWTNYCNIT